MIDPFRFAKSLMIKILFLWVLVAITTSGLFASLVEDPKLENVLRRKTRTPEGEIPPNKILDIEELHAANKGIQSVKGIHKLPNLFELNLSNNEISDLEPIGYLENLYTLDLSGNPISNLEAIEYCPNLNELLLMDCKIQDLSPILNFPQIYRVKLQGNSTLDLGPESHQRKMYNRITAKGVFLDLDDQQYKSLVSEEETPYEEPQLEDEIDFDAGLELRTWTSSDGKQIRATLLWTDKKKNLYLEMENEKIFKIPSSRLSERDAKISNYWSQRDYLTPMVASIKGLVVSYPKESKLELSIREITLPDLKVCKVKALGSKAVIWFGNNMGNPVLRVDLGQGDIDRWGSYKKKSTDGIRFSDENQSLVSKIQRKGNIIEIPIVRVPESITLKGYLGLLLGEHLTFKHARRD